MALSKLEFAKKSTYGEIVPKDCYGLNNWNNNFFDVIVDIGANVGIFVLYAHMRHPKSKIIAYEPCKETFKLLVENTRYLKNVSYFNEALGDGSKLELCDTGYLPCNLFFKEGENAYIGRSVNSYLIDSKRLPQIFDDNKIDLKTKYYIKVDCEGGERFLLDDKNSTDIIKGSAGSGIELHFPHGTKSPERFKSFPEWKTYSDWINDNFRTTHNIIYHCSSRSRGAGIYLLIRKTT
jgi:FkbM family methyltransferase